MSYILDALRKSEEARRRQQGPDLSLADPTPDPQRGRPSRALPLLALALLVNGGVLGFWLLRPGEQAPGQTVAESTPEPVPIEPAANRNSSPAANAEPAAASLSTPAPAPGADRPVDHSEIDWRQQPVLHLDDLTPQSRDRFPSLAISTHIYAHEPRFREVSINGRRYQEGDSVAGSLLLEITETGVLMVFEEQVIRLDLQDEWAL